MLEELQRRLDAQATNPEVTIQDLRFFDPAAAAICADGLKRHMVLKSLNLTRCDINSNDFSKIMAGVSGQSQLQPINAVWNHIGSSLSGGQALVGVVQSCPQLAKLNFRNNQIGDDTGKYFADIVAMNPPALKSLNLSDNAITDVTAERFIRALQKSNRNLTNLQLGGNLISNQNLNDIEDLLAKNSAGKGNEVMKPSRGFQRSPLRPRNGPGPIGVIPPGRAVPKSPL